MADDRTPLFLPANLTGMVTRGGNHYFSEELGGKILVRAFDIAEATSDPWLCTDQRVNLHSDVQAQLAARRAAVPAPVIFSPTLAAE